MRLHKLTVPLIEVKLNKQPIGKLINRMITNYCIFNLFLFLNVISTQISNVATIATT